VTLGAVLRRQEDGQGLVSASNGFAGAGCEIKLWDRRVLRKLASLEGHSESVTGVAFLPSSSKLVASCSQDSTLRLWDAHNAADTDSPAPVTLTMRHLQPAHRLAALSACAISGGSTSGEVYLHTASISGALAK